MTATMNTWWLFIGHEEIKIELKQLEDEGRDPAPVKAGLERLLKLSGDELRLPKNQEKAGELFDRARTLKMRKGYEFDEPSDLKSIRKLRPRGPRKYARRLPDKVLLDRITAAWTARCCGCLLGRAPIEGARSWEMEGFLKMTGQWPLRDYFRFGVRGKAAREYPKFTAGAHLDTIDHMPVDDDTNYTTTGFLLVKQRGADFAPRDAADFWMMNIPLLATCTAERVAYRNFAMNLAPPDSATFRNPFREWIGAQIRADAFGYLNAGDPQRAAEFGWRDASISHVKNGIYGEMWAAAMIAAAPYCETFEEIIRVGLSEIPRTSRLHAAVSEVLDWRKRGLTYEAAVQKIHDRWDEQFHHDWCHTITNAVIVAVGLLWGEDDFGTSICRAVTPGYDTDCNAATIGSVFGMRYGTEALPEKWTRKINNTLKTSLVGYETVRLDQIARETWELARKIR
ncbi:MAG TPA: ADP-ribosylglycohydrolase family protein [Candidatus Sumerlaeota bacterium]|nr:ADP-ribosylglycohydrolase family protein [Candidatus Sumerlaeota bacterium]HOR26986.1 ADP-ribosylglycohydrolase family protein [Candidatus Sumerlaeota bacterium]HPK02142.1 ADP-ribosylglycohydrolase family protein [Candidatus Sumerlaeota bacterium]